MDMLEWLSRRTLYDVSINAVPVFILAYFSLLFGLADPWGLAPLVIVMTHVLTLLPLVLLVFATFHVARAIERDASRS